MQHPGWNHWTSLVTEKMHNKRGQRPDRSTFQRVHICEVICRVPALYWDDVLAVFPNPSVSRGCLMGIALSRTPGYNAKLIAFRRICRKRSSAAMLGMGWRLPPESRAATADAEEVLKLTGDTSHCSRKDRWDHLSIQTTASHGSWVSPGPVGKITVKLVKNGSDGCEIGLKGDGAMHCIRCSTPAAHLSQRSAQVHQRLGLQVLVSSGEGLSPDCSPLKAAPGSSPGAPPTGPNPQEIRLDRAPFLHQGTDLSVGSLHQ